MSVHAISWALRQQEVTEPITRFVLVCLADHAQSDGSAAFPSVLTMSRETGLSERAIRYHLKKLVLAMLIRRGNQAIAAAYIKKVDRRPIVYDLIMERGATDAPRRGTGCTTGQTGVHIASERGAPHAPNPSLGNPSLNKSVLQTSKAEKDGLAGLRMLKAQMTGKPVLLPEEEYDF